MIVTFCIFFPHFHLVSEQKFKYIRSSHYTKTSPHYSNRFYPQHHCYLLFSRAHLFFFSQTTLKTGVISVSQKTPCKFTCLPPIWQWFIPKSFSMGTAQQCSPSDAYFFGEAYTTFNNRMHVTVSCICKETV